MQPAPYPRSARALLFVCMMAVGFGVYLRVQQISFPPVLTFDEHHFVENARNYIAGNPDWNDHPPLGKLLMAGAMLLLGDNATGWRATALCCGILSIALAYLAGRALFRDRLAGALAAAFFALDGFLVAYSRTALLDGLLLCFALLSLSALVPSPSRVRVVVAGALLGLTASIKLSGITIALPLALSVTRLRESRKMKGLLFGLSGLSALTTYDLQWVVGQKLTGLPASPLAVARASLALIKHHAALTQMTHPLTSHWYTWFLPLRPITVRYDLTEGGAVRAMTTLGNPLLWWASAVVMLGVLGRLGRLAADGLHARKLQTHGVDLDQTWPVLLLSAFFWGFLAPWMLTGRDSYVYHYLPCYGFALLLLAGVFARAFRSWPLATLLAVLVIAEVSVFYAPVWAQLPLSEEAFKWRLFFPGWR